MELEDAEEDSEVNLQRRSKSVQSSKLGGQDANGTRAVHGSQVSHVATSRVFMDELCGAFEDGMGGAKIM